MSSTPNWREPSDIEKGPLQRHEIAMRYLARNRDFQSDYNHGLEAVKARKATVDEATLGLIETWGLSYPANPGAPHDMSRIHVRPGLSPVTLELTERADTSSPRTGITAPVLGPMHDCLNRGDCRHILLANDDGDLHIHLSGSDGEPLILQLPFDRDLHLRLAAAERLRRHVAGVATGPPPLLLPPLQHQRLTLMLRAWDGRASGASARELAAVLIDARVAAYGAALWSDSRQRRQIGRWLHDARKLIEGGYLGLLRGR